MLRGEVIEIPAVRVGDVGPQSGALSSFERITTNISCESLASERRLTSYRPRHPLVREEPQNGVFREHRNDHL